jgi:hypothetical protein
MRGGHATTEPRRVRTYQVVATTSAQERDEIARHGLDGGRAISTAEAQASLPLAVLEPHRTDVPRDAVGTRRCGECAPRGGKVKATWRARLADEVLGALRS